MTYSIPTTVEIRYNFAGSRIVATLSDGREIVFQDKVEANRWLQEMKAVPATDNAQACCCCGLLSTYLCGACKKSLCQSCFDGGKNCLCRQKVA